MYPTSNAYKTAIRQASRPYDTVYGTVTFTNGDVDTINDSTLPADAISISKQCIGDGALEFGGVYLSTLKLDIITDRARYDYYDARIELFYKIKVGTETVEGVTTPVYETIPLGIYKVADAERKSNKVSVTAYDSLTLLDIPIGGRYLSGTAWQILSEVSTITQYPLAFTEEFLEDFPNYNREFSASDERGLKTFRDVVKVVCQHLGCFALDDRTGKLTLKMFSATEDAELSTSDWYELTPADYYCTYIALSVTSTAGTYTKTVDDPMAYGNIMVMSDAPAWDYGTPEELQAKTDELFEYLITIDEYTPCEMEMPSDPTFECGDRLTLNAKINGTVSAISTLITEVEWKYHSGMTVKSEGKNPFLEGGDIADAESDRIITQSIEKDKLQFVTFTNNTKHVIGDGVTKEIGRTTFTPTANTNALFVATILVDVDVDDETETETEEVEVPVKAYDEEQEETVITDINGNPVTLSGVATNTYTYYRDGKCKLSIYYTMNDERVPSDISPYLAVEEIEKGKHIITVSYPISGLAEYQRVQWKVFMTCEGGKVTLKSHTLQGTIVGQEIKSLSRFGGEIKAEDTLVLEQLCGLGVLTITDNVKVNITNAVSIKVSDTISPYDIMTLGVMDFTDSVQIARESEFPWGTEDDNYWATEDDKKWITE